MGPVNDTTSIAVSRPDAANGHDQAPMVEAQHLEAGRPTQMLNPAATDDSDAHQFDDQAQRLPFARMTAAYICLCFCYFISYLDMNSITTSTAVISDALEAGPSITWVGTAYLLGQTSCQPLYGRVSDIVGRKPVLLFSVGCIAFGGLLGGFAQNPQWLYLCRAISGTGSGGISSSVAIIVSDLVSLKSRGKYQGLISLAIGIGASTGPFVAAGLLATGPDGWRWAFRVPSIGAAGCCCLLIFFLPQKPVYGDWRAKVSKVDWLGVVTSVAGLVLLLIPINSGGSLWSWTNVKTISTITVGAVLLITFVAVEAYMARTPIIPLQLFRRRSPAILFITGILYDFVWQTTQYFVPLYFQTVRGYTPLQSATLILPFLLAQGLAGAASGPVMARLARYTNVLRIGFLLWTLGAGLKLLFNQGTSTAVCAVVLAIEGAGVGWVHQPGLVAQQANSRDQDRAVVTSTRNVLRSLGGVLGVAVSTAAYYAVLDRNLRGKVPDSLRTQVLSGTWRLGDRTTEVYQPAILDARMNGFKFVFAISVPLMALCLLAVFFVDDLELQGDAKPEPQPGTQPEPQPDAPQHREKVQA
ncbi:Uu.00g023210.m01.CDS01 [Anthostomella pinea]|uniref:Uu.00g023210.m01.CDS01 n=1 Tax=Anthostomella pinea TaxID=933095 RepID=A0AAI8VZZ9_9PEZI|nr:Uu.00g023210.m01.CDS01 [Anthostomella pinea]